MSYAQLTNRGSLRDIEKCLTALQIRQYHCGISYAVPRNTLAKANEKRNQRIYADFAQVLVNKVRPLYAKDDFHLDLDNMVYAFDSMRFDITAYCEVDESTGVIADEKTILIGLRTSQWYPEEIRMVTYEDYATNNFYRFLTNNMEYETLTI